jgi:hypothetical protein
MNLRLFLGLVLVASHAVADALRISTRVERRQHEIGVAEDGRLVDDKLHRRATSASELAFPDNL